MNAWSTSIKHIRALYESDPEVAHSLEDDLLWGFVRWEAEELKNPVAAELLQLDETERTRWYA